MVYTPRIYRTHIDNVSLVVTGNMINILVGNGILKLSLAEADALVSPLLSALLDIEEHEETE